MMKGRVFLFLSLVLPVAFGLSPALGQEGSERPRIGLCLAGGGARGGAHIGVLQVLEELHIPIDYVAGTSIGSIIGGLYSSGMSPAEMDSVLSGVDWGDLFHDSPERRLINFRRKSEDHLPYLDFEVGMGKDGLKLPAGLVAGPKLLYLLRSLTLPSVGIDDFDDLPIPFRAVASDLSDGTMVVIDHGTVADAMRASMAIPGAFTPHVIDGRILVDGGFQRNVPYDVVKSMGADIIIVVDVGPALLELDKDPSMVGILDQAMTMSIVTNARESLKQMGDEDILLVPDLVGFGVESFDRMGETVERGVSVANANLELLRSLSIPEKEYETWQEQVRAGYAPRELTVGSVSVDSHSRVDSRRIRAQVKSLPNADLDMGILEEDLSRVYRLGEFELVDYALEQGPDPDTRNLVIRTKDKRWGPNYLRFGTALEGHVDGQSSFIILLYHRMAAINRLGAEWRNQVTIGDRLLLDTEFYQPVTLNGRFFVAPKFVGQIVKRNRWFELDQSELVSSQEILGNFDVGLNMSHWGELRLGVYSGGYWGSIENEDQDFDEDTGGWRGRLSFDQLDNVYFPRKGWATTLNGRLSRANMGATTEYDRLEARILGAATTGRTTFSARFEGGTAFGDHLPFHDRFELGGFSRLSGIESGRIFGDEAALLVLGSFFRVASLNPALGGNVYLGVSGELGQAWQNTEESALDDMLLGGTLYLGVESLLGPFYMGYGLVEGGYGSFYVLLGRTF